MIDVLFFHYHQEGIQNKQRKVHTEIIFSFITHNYSLLICCLGSKGQATLKYMSAIQQHWFTYTEALVVGDICKIYDNSTPHITL